MERGRAAAVVVLLAGIALVGLGALGLVGSGPLALTAAVQPAATPGAATGAPSASAAASPPASAAPATAAPATAPAPTIAPSTAPTAAPTIDRLAAVSALYARIVPAVRANDVETLMALLHPATVERYGVAACRAYFAGLRDPTFNVVIRSVGAPAPWVWDRDGRSTTIADGWAVQADLTANGATAAQEIHVAPVGGEPRWFTDCGTPVG